jgi:DNA-binding CsgD family transcriptional regulator
MKELSTHNRESRRTVGFVGSFTMLGFASSEHHESGGLLQFFFDEGSVLPDDKVVYLAFAAFFLVTALIVSLGFMQALLFFLLSAIQCGQKATGNFGLGFALIASMLLFRQGWFLRRPAMKAVIASAIGGFALLGPLFAPGGRGVMPSNLIWFGVYVIIVIGLARNRYFSALGPKKRLLRLSDFKLTKRERQVVKMRITGMSIKEISFEIDIAASTVYNLLSIAYRKLGIENGEDLMTMSERYTVE